MACVLTITLTVPDSRPTMIEKLGINAAATQIDANGLVNVISEVVNGSQAVTSLVIDLDGAVTVTNPHI
jgi:hypothetical protein